MKSVSKRALISAGVGALLILVLTSVLIANAALQSGQTQRAATRGNVGAAGNPTSAGPHVTFSLTPTSGVTPGVGSPSPTGSTGSSGPRQTGGGPATPGATPGSQPTGVPANPTPMSFPFDDIRAIGPTTPTVPEPIAGRVFQYWITLIVQNTGTTTWDAPGDQFPYLLLCQSQCLGAASLLTPYQITSTVAPGGQYQFRVRLLHPVHRRQ